MIDLGKISNKIIPSLSVASKPLQSAVTQKTEVSNLNDLPHYKIISPIIASKETLAEFIKNYGKPKSATYVCEEIKQAKLKGNSDILDDLFLKRRMYSGKIKLLRAKVNTSIFKSFEEYAKKLDEYIKENGAYMNCTEASDLALAKLLKSGQNAKNVFMYSTNKNGQRTNQTEHVFCIVGLDKNAKINDPSTWGVSAAVCDPWANVALKAKDALGFYKKFFNIDSTKCDLKFEYFNR